MLVRIFSRCSHFKDVRFAGIASKNIQNIKHVYV